MLEMLPIAVALTMLAGRLSAQGAAGSEPPARGKVVVEHSAGAIELPRSGTRAGLRSAAARLVRVGGMVTRHAGRSHARRRAHRAARDALQRALERGRALPARRGAGRPLHGPRHAHGLRADHDRRRAAARGPCGRRRSASPCVAAPSRCRRWSSRRATSACCSAASRRASRSRARRWRPFRRSARTSTAPCRGCRASRRTTSRRSSACAADRGTSCTSRWTVSSSSSRSI